MPDETDNVTTLPDEQRLADIREAAGLYLIRTDLPICVENKPYVRELAAMLGSPEGWAAFASAARLAHTSNNMQVPSRTALGDYLKDMKAAVIRTLREARQREERGSASVMTVDQMLDSDSQYLVGVGLLLKNARGRIWYDEFLCKIRSDWMGDPDLVVVAPYDVTDDAMGRFRMYLTLQRVDIMHNLSSGLGKEVVAYVAYSDRRDALKEHLDSLPEWDTTPRLDTYLTHAFGVEVDDENGQTAEYIRVVGRNFLIAMMARALSPGCKADQMLILFGAQGAFKSSAMQILGGPFFREIHESPNSKDFYIQLQGVWLGEVAELASIASSKVETAKVKAMLSRQVDNFRPPYAATGKDHPRRGTLSGTTNQQGFGRDETGNRRFPVLVVVRVDLEWLKANRDQLLAEALKEYRAGATWWEMPADAHSRVTERFQAVSVYEEVVRDKLLSADVFDGTPEGPTLQPVDMDMMFDDPARWGNTVTALRVAVQWLGMTMEAAPRHAGDISNILTRAGWRSKVTSGRVRGQHRAVRCWVPTDVEGRREARRTGVLHPPSGNSRPGESEIPF